MFLFGFETQTKEEKKRHDMTERDGERERETHEKYVWNNKKK